MAIVMYKGDADGVVDDFRQVARKYDGVGDTEVYVWGFKRGGEMTSFVCAVVASPEMCGQIDATLSKYSLLSPSSYLRDVSRAECVFPQGVPMAAISGRIQEVALSTVSDITRLHNSSRKSIDDLLKERSANNFRARS